MAAARRKKVHVEYQSSDSGSEGDLEVSDDGGESIDEDGDGDRQTGLANVMAKILQKKVPKHKQVILAKGQKRKAVTEDGNEADSSTGPGGAVMQHEKRKLWENMCRVKPEPLEKDKERQFQRIATRGVVQLFNAVRKQQKLVDEEVGMVGSSVRRRDKVMEGMTKDRFMNILKGTTSNVKVEKPDKPDKEIKTEPVEEEEDEQKWSIFRDDYMMGAKMKDWNKDSSEEEGQDDPVMSDESE